MDNYARYRELSFTAVIPALGLDMAKYKTRKGGEEWFGPCPVHKPKNNQTSFSYDISGRFHCFSCQAKGKGGIDLVKVVRQCSFTEAVAFLEELPAPKATEAVPAKENAPAADSDVLRPLEKDTWSKYKVPCEWLEKRIPDAAIREAYGVFCYNNPARKSVYSGRVMLPVRDVEGVLFGYLGRRILDSSDCPTDTPKYLFPKNLPKSRFLFGAAELKAGRFGQLPLKRIWLVESPFCVLKYASVGIPAVSSFGWAVSEEQVDLLAELAKGCIFLPDSNKQAECDAVCRALSRKLWLRFPELPSTIHDPEQMGQDQILAL